MRVDKLLTTYRVLAWIVGSLIITLFVGVGFKYLLTEGTDVQRLGVAISMIVGIAHGWLYMVYLVVVAILAKRERWTPIFTVTTLLVGLIPVATFIAERRATRAVLARSPHPHS